MTLAWEGERVGSEGKDGAGGLDSQLPWDWVMGKNSLKKKIVSCLSIISRNVKRMIRRSG